MYSLSLILFLFCCLWATGAEANRQWNKYTYVNPSNGSNTIDCGTLTCPCRNLSYALQGVVREPATMFVLSPGTHYLDNTTYCSPFTLSGLGMRGSASVVECVGLNAGLSFIGASNITLEGITFSHCAALQNSTSRNFSVPLDTLEMYQFYVGLYFYLCENVSMDGIVVTNSLNATGVVMFDTTGNITITQSNFTNNKVDSSSGNKYPGGGGFYIEFTYCPPGDAECTSTQNSANSDSHYTFLHCDFRSNNNTLSPHSHLPWFTPSRGVVHNAFGRGGGLSVFLKGNASSNTFEILNCTFEYNSAQWGGGLAVHMLDSVAGNVVMIDGCSFVANWLHFERDTSGGGIDIVYCVLENQGNNVISVTRSKLSNNSASTGGALSVLAARQDTTRSQTATVKFCRTDFDKNKAGIGAAAFISRNMVVWKGEMVKIEFSDSNFVNNSLKSDRRSIHLEGVGAVYTDKISVQFRKSITFKGNQGSALGVTATYIDFSACSVSFENNSGFNGGAIALLGSAWIILDDTTSMNFTSNYAVMKGGALYNRYIEKQDLRVYYNCFLVHSSTQFIPPNHWNNSFVFENNNAGFHGKSIYSTSIWPCTGSDADHHRIFCWGSNWQYTRNGTRNPNCTGEIGSDVGKITSTSSKNETVTVQAFPGKPFTLPLEVKDNLGKNLTENTVFTASIPPHKANYSVPDFTYVSHKTAVLFGHVGTHTLTLDTVSDQAWHITIHVKLKQCPPGFRPSSGGKNASCVCSGLYGKQLTCNNDKHTSRLTNAYWMGTSPHDSETVVIGYCHDGFCLSDPNHSSFRLPNTISNLDSYICGPQNRTGVLCGKCMRGYAPAVNSDTFHCVSCNDTVVMVNIAYYALSVYLPLFILFLVIILFNVRLTTGPAVAFILYSQVVSSIFYPSADGHIPLNTITNHSRSIAGVYMRSYGIFNLEFIENFIHPLCLGKNLNSLDVLQLDYIVALFPLLMIIIVLVFIKLKAFVLNRCRRGRLAVHTQQVTSVVRRLKLGSSLLHAFAAFMLLSYTKFSLTSSYISTYQRMADENNIKIGPPRVFYAGHYTTNDHEYKLRYLLPAVLVFATFVAIPPLLLLHYPVRLLENCINRVHFLRRLYPTAKVHILLDTFQGCYRDNMRFFAGLYFVFRLILHISYIMTPGMLVQGTVQQIVCTVFTVLVATCQPYTRKFLNYVDTLMFANLAVINSLTLFLCMYAEKNPGTRLPVTPFVVQYILILLPWLYMIGYVAWYLMSHYHGTLARKWRGFFHKGTTNTAGQSVEQQPVTDWQARVSVSTTHIDAVEVADEQWPPDDMEALWKRAEADNLYRAPQQVPVNQQEPGEGGQEEDDQLGQLLSQRQLQIQHYGSTW